MIASVYVVDDDPAVRDAIVEVLKAASLRVEAFADAESFLAACQPNCAGCLVLDNTLPGMSGAELQAAMLARSVRIPVIFITGNADVPTAVQVLKSGAFDFLEKPIRAEALLARVRAALAADLRRRRREARQKQVEEKVERLTPREREVLQLLVLGMSNKEIGRRLRISHRTVEVHRARLLQKTGAETPREIATLAETARLKYPLPP
ncbi:MAG TPA: response regulator, partial [Pelomicrobium sp.]|nr:response regulator [Pelomicrobium sp.]